MTKATHLRLLLARHGETEWNRAGRYQGRGDPPLSTTGEAQACRLGALLRGAGVGIIVSSALRRAWDTAQFIGDALGLPVLGDDRLAEVGYGEWEGLRQADIKQRWPDLLRQWKRFPGDARAPGGESLVEARERLLGFVRHPPWQGRDPSGAVLLVTHSAIIRIARLEAERQPWAAFREVGIAPASLYRCGLMGDRLVAATACLEAHAAGESGVCPAETGSL